MLDGVSFSPCPSFLCIEKVIRAIFSEGSCTCNFALGSGNGYHYFCFTQRPELLLLKGQGRRGKLRNIFTMGSMGSRIFFGKLLEITVTQTFECLLSSGSYTH